MLRETLYILILPGSKGTVHLIVKLHRKHKNFDLLNFEGYPNINDVEHWKTGILKVSEEQLIDLTDNEFYFHEIIGCSVLNCRR